MSILTACFFTAFVLCLFSAMTLSCLDDRGLSLERFLLKVFSWIGAVSVVSLPVLAIIWIWSNVK